MNNDKNILVATNVEEDADVVRDILANEYTHIHLSTDPDCAAGDFDAICPDVLILAFSALEKAKLYNIALNRDSQHSRSHLYRTLLLCDARDLQQVYALCKQSVYDDYVLFWPLSKDATRLPMAVHHALQSLEDVRHDGPVLRTLAEQARRIAELETLVHQMRPQGDQHSEGASKSLQQAKLDIDDFTDKRPDSVEAAVDTGRESNNAFKNNFQHIPALKATRELESSTDPVSPTVLVVDDDEFQFMVVKQVFAEAKLKLIYANSATEALSVLRRQSVDVVLLDIQMPGISGIEMLYQLKSIESLAGIPTIMMTGHREENIVLQCLNAGASGYVVKPFNKEELYTKVHKLLATSKA